MKKILIVLAAVGICFGLVGLAAAADNGTTAETVTVSGFALVNVPATSAITLTNPATAGADYPCVGTPDNDSAAAQKIQVSHNKVAAQKVTATATKAALSATNNITLNVKVGTRDIAPIVTAGTDVVGGAVCFSNASGIFDESIVFSVSNATSAATKVGSYIWDVVFTIADAA